MRGRIATRSSRLNLQFFQETWAELKKVVWPSRKQATNLTLIVIAVSAAVGLLLGAIDFAFYLVFQQLILQAGGGS
ncbi:MAG: preprotein translocase subunit SecE [Dehalococcoidia bacterium]|nr:preprotein translocase subunit SecE [Dehalococcoidia bacterium]